MIVLVRLWFCGFVFIWFLRSQVDCGKGGFVIVLDIMKRGKGASDNKNPQKPHTFEVNASLLGDKPVLKSLLKTKLAKPIVTTHVESDVGGTKSTDRDKDSIHSEYADVHVPGNSDQVGADYLTKIPDLDIPFPNVDNQVGGDCPIKIPGLNSSEDGDEVRSDNQGGVKQPSSIPKVYTETYTRGLDRLEAVTEVVQEAVLKQFPVHAPNTATSKGVSFANVVATDATSNKKVNFRTMESAYSVESDFDVAIPLASVEEVNSRLNNSLYGYFIGKRLAFPVVENYVWNAWGKFGLQKIMMNAKGFFFFKFSSLKGVEDVLENGPWMIRGIPIILNKWNPSVSLTKEDLSRVPVWVKMHDVPIAAFTQDGLSIIATKIGTPLMLDTYTSNMCVDSWGRSSYARAMIELHADRELKESVVVAVPKLDGSGYTRETVRVEYEWKPPRCDVCKVFGHNSANCPNCVKEVPKVVTSSVEDGFNVPKKVTKRTGIPLNKQKPTLVYRPVVRQNAKGGSSTQPIKLSNTFSGLNMVDEADVHSANPQMKGKEQVMDDSDEEVDNVYDETSKFMSSSVFVDSEGASTPVHNVSDV